METNEYTLPITSKKVVLRQYTTRADDEAYRSALYKDATVDGSGQVNIPGDAALRAQDVYVYRLVISIDGSDANIAAQLDDLRSLDYAFIKKEVDKIVDANSPKE